MRIGRVVLFVKDLDVMSSFYGETLGLKSIAGGDDTWREFEAGDCGLGLHAIPVETAGGIEIASPPEPREENPFKLVFIVDDVEGELARLEAAGVSVLRRPWGACDCADPEGNVFQVEAS